jgi:hypothetical protein
MKISEIFENVSKSNDNSTFNWSSLDHGLSFNDKIEIFESYCLKSNLKESNNNDKSDFFKSLFDMSDNPVKNKKYIAVPLSLIDNRIRILDKPDYMTFLNQTDQEMIFNHKGKKVKYPSETIRQISIFNTFTFSNIESYNKFRTIINLKFDADLPNIEEEKPQFRESATAGATSAGNIATVANPHISPGKARGKKSYTGSPGRSGTKSPPQPKPANMTGKNALDMKTSLFGEGNAIKR